MAITGISVSVRLRRKGKEKKKHAKKEEEIKTNLEGSKTKIDAQVMDGDIVQSGDELDRIKKEIIENVGDGEDEEMDEEEDDYYNPYGNDILSTNYITQDPEFEEKEGDGESENETSEWESQTSSSLQPLQDNAPLPPSIFRNSHSQNHPKFHSFTVPSLLSSPSPTRQPTIPPSSLPVVDIVFLTSTLNSILTPLSSKYQGKQINKNNSSPHSLSSPSVFSSNNYVFQFITCSYDGSIIQWNLKPPSAVSPYFKQKEKQSPSVSTSILFASVARRCMYVHNKPRFSSLYVTTENATLRNTSSHSSDDIFLNTISTSSSSLSSLPYSIVICGSTEGTIRAFDNLSLSTINIGLNNSHVPDQIKKHCGEVHSIGMMQIRTGELRSQKGSDNIHLHLHLPSTRNHFDVCYQQHSKSSSPTPQLKSLSIPFHQASCSPPPFPSSSAEESKETLSSSSLLLPSSSQESYNFPSAFPSTKERSSSPLLSSELNRGISPPPMKKQEDGTLSFIITSSSGQRFAPIPSSSIYRINKSYFSVSSCSSFPDVSTQLASLNPTLCVWKIVDKMCEKNKLDSQSLSALSPSRSLISIVPIYTFFNLLSSSSTVILDHLIIFCDKYGNLYAFDAKKFILYEEIEREKEKERKKKADETAFKNRQKQIECANEKKSPKKVLPIPPPSVIYLK
jgi:hypothetical protein